ncbi:hypothetical protein [Sagittula sp. MA-2]|jgi:hypothetical protein|uniref:hypothetical protein n=1 Tax=Sagittula sp. MA-2 TaxID=3048007 RepID=UPI0024C35B18|nr:hypothetical protein [Sagittula sp. MA-2]WHZ36526.1 hypothetical protein QNI11_05810 [Sagittula sp. MA-2]
MKTAYYETENSAGSCPILEDDDLEVMTDEELIEERKNWIMNLDDDDPMAWDVACNYRLVEKHIDRRGIWEKV